ncbi:uncharacterized protein LOC111376371 [Olea europaea var. sylvestris]|uniref:uncharacterized protein LOC111376371 n=1 Tax=Olea europaea var. sylvestris TaxID=158386 RepID=UPI000C1D488E|nr:uncharacterized protein LOC111376371 [Olea europaea var. sylvestris]
MERSEPTLVPEWLKNGGSLVGGGTASHSDDHTASKVSRNKSLVTSNGHDLGRPSGMDRTNSSFRRSSSSNGSGHLRSYSSSAKNHRDREWEDTCGYRDKEKSALGDRRQQYILDPLGGDILSSKFERDGLRRSQSMISGKRGESWPKKVVTDSSNSGGNNSNGVLNKGSPISSVNKATFERDFPSLGAEERPATPEDGRIPSPGLSTAIQNLPIGTSAMIGGEKWTSALAEVPVLTGRIATPSSSAPLALGTTTGLNMAATVAQGPTRAQTIPQLSAGTQRLEELAMKQFKQLIPVTPSMSKPLVMNSLDKQKAKGGQQQHPISPSLSVSHSPRGGLVKSDISKTNNVGKLHVLKPARERNAVSSAAKDNPSPTSGSKLVNSSLLSMTPSASGAAPIMGSAYNSIIPNAEHKPVLTTTEKRPTPQAQSRNDFFKLMRKKSVANSSSVPDQSMANTFSVSDHGTAVSPPASDKVGELEVTALGTPNAGDAPSCVSPGEGHLSDKNDDLTCNGDAFEGQKYVSNGKKYQNSVPIISDEEEAAFLRSMGWEENADEGGLTEEEISEFYRVMTKKQINSKPSLKILLQVQPRILSQIGSIGGISSGLSSSETKLES